MTANDGLGVAPQHHRTVFLKHGSEPPIIPDVMSEGTPEADYLPDYTLVLMVALILCSKTVYHGSIK